MERAEPFPRRSVTVLPKLSTVLPLITKRAQHPKNARKWFFGKSGLSSARPLRPVAAAEEEGDAPEGGDPHQREDNPADHAGHPAEERPHQVVLEKADAAPVDTADHDEQEGNPVNPVHPNSFLSENPERLGRRPTASKIFSNLV